MEILNEDDLMHCRGITFLFLDFNPSGERGWWIKRKWSDLRIGFRPVLCRRTV